FLADGAVRAAGGMGAQKALAMKILFGNIGYARGIDGTLQAHMRGFHRHFYSSIEEQRRVLGDIRGMMQAYTPDLCCFVEVDSGSFHSARLNHIEELADDDYAYYDIACKYGEGSPLAFLPLYQGKGNGFLARMPLSFQKLYFR